MTAHNPGQYALQQYPDWHVTSLDLGGALAITVPAYKLIAVERSLDRYLWDESLDHETAHLDLGHGKTSSCWHERKQEQACWRYSAHRMVPFRALVRAVQWCGLEPSALADELGRSRALIVCRLNTAHPAEKHYLRQIVAAKGEAA